MIKKVYFAALLLSPLTGIAMDQNEDSSISFASYDCSFTKDQLSKLTAKEFSQLPHEAKVELAILFEAAKTDQAAVDLYRLLPRNTRQFVLEFAENVPTVFDFCSWEDRKSARGIVLKMTLKAIAMGCVKSIPEHLVKHLITGGLASAF